MQNHFIIVGAGRVGKVLLEKLAPDYDLLCIDVSADALEGAKKIRDGNLAVAQGDATSRLVLEKAGAAEAACVIITPSEEEINIEVARVLKEQFRPRRMIAIASTVEGTKKLESFGAEVQNIFAASAIEVRNQLEQRIRTASTIGLGRNEILEVEVHPYSRLANKPIKHLAPLNWKIGIIYRDGRIIIPYGDVMLLPRDRVVILGDPEILKTVSAIMTFNFERFPLEYGSLIVAGLTGGEDEAFFAELEYLCGLLPVKGVIFAYTEGAVRREAEYGERISNGRFQNVEERKTGLPFQRAMTKVLGEDHLECGLVVLSQAALGNPYLAFARKRLFMEICDIVCCPVLIARGTFPYERSAVPVTEGMNPRHALEVALEMSLSLGMEVATLFVEPSAYTASDEELKTFDLVRRQISSLGTMYRVNVAKPELHGNPVKAVLETLHAYNLLVAETGSLNRRRWYRSLLTPDTAWHIVRGSPVSALLIPPVEESL